ncbi:unnamed protein product [Caenorhabditis auriculariae]|uniref:Galectin n=1 Tax=Caenorhabditis auriculariae TaxID=2777116 RepID=A0A8S1H185_9PELO|nr:unnamed protein product [Caenorhabditis auriculariae]
MKILSISAFFVLLPVVFCHYKHAEKDYSCRKLSPLSKGYHPDMMSRFVEFKRELRIGDVIVIRGRLGPGVLPQKRFYLDFPVGPTRYLKPKPATFPSTFHFSAQYDTGKQIGAWFDGKDFRDIVTGNNLFTAAPFTIKIEVKQAGYEFSKDGVYVGYYGSLVYNTVSSIYMENVAVDDTHSCNDGPRCERLHGDKMTVIIADGHVQHIIGSCRW